MVLWRGGGGCWGKKLKLINAEEKMKKKVKEDKGKGPVKNASITVKNT